MHFVIYRSQLVYPTLNKDSYIRPEFIVENDNPEKITTYSNMDTFEFSVSKSMLEDKLSQQ